MFLLTHLHGPQLDTHQEPVIVALRPVVTVTPTWTPHCDPFLGWGSLGAEVRSPLLRNRELWSAWSAAHNSAFTVISLFRLVPLHILPNFFHCEVACDEQ